MNTLTIPAGSPDPVIRCRPPILHVDGSLRTDLLLERVQFAGPPDFGQARIVVSPSMNRLPRAEQTRLLPPIGAAVRIAGFEGGQFHGYISEHHVELSDAGETLTAAATHRLANDLAGLLSRRWHLADGELVELADVPVRLNAGWGTLASANPVDLRGRSARVFDAGASAVPWTVADALAYLLAVAAPADLHVPGLDELTELAGDVPLPRLDLTGRSALDALQSLTSEAGLALRAGRDEPAIIVYRPGGDGPTRSVHLQPAGLALDRSQTNLHAGTIRLSRRPGRRGVVVIGGPRIWEATFPLQPGWDRQAQFPAWRDTLAGAGDAPATSAVLRRWLLNEHGGYSGPPWNLARFDLSAISAEDFAGGGPRRFSDCLSRDPAGQRLGAFVQFRVSASADWQAWPGGVAVSDEQCAIELLGPLPAAFFQAAAAETVEVRVTASVAGDAHLTARIDGDTNLPPRVVRAAHRFGWAKVHESSALAGRADLPAPVECDDSAAIEAFAARLVGAADHTVQAQLSLGWVDTSYHVGDRIAAVDGRALPLATAPGALPAITRVTHTWAHTQQTTFTVGG